MTFQTLTNSLLSCPMCDAPKKKVFVRPSSDSFVDMYSGSPAAAQTKGASMQLAANADASRPVYGHPTSRWAGAKKAFNPYPKNY